jgi:hypothetical protein
VVAGKVIKLIDPPCDSRLVAIRFLLQAYYSIHVSMKDNLNTSNRNTITK